MSNLEANQARLMAALETLEFKIQALKSGDATEAANAELTAKITSLEAQVETLKEAGSEAIKDLDIALAQLEDLGVSHG